MIPSIIPLLFANSIPLIGVVFFKWDISSLFVAYWLETVVIGLVNILKMVKIREAGGFFDYFPIVFYIVHFGLYCYGLLSFSVKYLIISKISIMSGLISSIPFLWSHLYSYYQNYLGKKEFLMTSIGKLTIQPYKRIIVMHFSFSLTAILIGLKRNTIWGVVLMVIIKTLFDVLAHLREHK